MKIVFICCSLEPGRDGVGDYTRRLACELIKQEHLATIIAVNDRYIVEEKNEVQYSDGRGIDVKRLPSTWSADNRFFRAKYWIDNIKPLWISLQFVIYGFQSKGLPFGLTKQLVRMGKGHHWHIMFHELWIGMDIHSYKIQRYLGLLQKNILRQLLFKLNPDLIHTHTRLYQDELGRLGFTTNYLPLFGNIGTCKPCKIKLEDNPTLLIDKNSIRLVIFGSIHLDAPVKIFANEAANYSKQYHVTISLIIVGRCGLEQENWATVWKSAGLTVEVLGEQSAEHISNILNNASLGISTTPIALAEKSGTIATMREHGLMVLCISRPWYANKGTVYSIPPGIVNYQVGKLREIFQSIHYNYAYNSLQDVATKFLTDLS